MTQIGLYPPSTGDDYVWYVLAQECYGVVNLVTWEWNAGKQVWQSVDWRTSDKLRFQYAPTEMERAGWVIMEEWPMYKEPLFDVTDVFGRKRD
jgi:hypothetical protein